MTPDPAPSLHSATVTKPEEVESPLEMVAQCTAAVRWVKELETCVSARCMLVLGSAGWSTVGWGLVEAEVQLGDTEGSELVDVDQGTLVVDSLSGPVVLD